MMEKPAIYVETSVLSYLVARRSRDLIVAAHQQITGEWWRNQRKNYDLFVSQLVVDEAREGDSDMAAKRMEIIEQLSLLEINDDATHLADALVKSRAVPKKAALDALHISVACVGAVDYLLTWNCKHIANAAMRSAIEETCRSVGYITPIICTPEELED
jgi:hypothetical protein